MEDSNFASSNICFISAAFFPASAGEKYYDQVRKDIYEFPGMYADILECGLSLINPTVHPGPCLVNLSNIEKPDFTFFLYEHGFQPSGLKIDVLLNEERLAIGKALGYRIHALEDFAGVEKIESKWIAPLGGRLASTVLDESMNEIADLTERTFKIAKREITPDTRLKRRYDYNESFDIE